MLYDVGRKLGIDIIILIHTVKSHRITSEILDRRERVLII